jgi:hypothetical protein
MRRALDEFVIEGIKPQYHFIDNSWMIQDISEIILTAFMDTFKMIAPE